MLQRIAITVCATIVTLGLSAATRAEVPAEAKLTPPPSGPIPVAFLLSPGATMIDFAGPWEVFQDVGVPGREEPFRLFTVSETKEPIVASGGMRIVPDHTFADAPAPRVIVVPAQRGSAAGVEWLRQASRGADITMSVCTGAFQLARAGLLDGRKATTHHEFYNQLARSHPAIDVQRDLRWVESRRVATAGGLTSGIDLALRVVARYFGEEIAEKTAVYMEHASPGWRSAAGLWDPTTDEQAAREATRRAASAVSPPVLRGLDPVLLARGREEPGRGDLVERHGRYTYAFASGETRDEFRSHPERFAIQLDGACAMMAKSGAGPGSGDPDRFLVHEGRIYIFASEMCREGFAHDPKSYLP
jgi:putative intracellular protease/amidase/YHS domain-containing protein